MRFDVKSFLAELYPRSAATVAPADPAQFPPTRYAKTARGYLVPENLPDVWRVWYDERAAIRELDEKQTREHAEAEALRETLDAMRARDKL